MSYIIYIYVIYLKSLQAFLFGCRTPRLWRSHCAVLADLDLELEEEGDFLTEAAAPSEFGQRAQRQHAVSVSPSLYSSWPPEVVNEQTLLHEALHAMHACT